LIPSYDVRSGRDHVATLTLFIEDALPVLRQLAEQRHERLALYRASDGVKLAAAVPLGMGLRFSDLL